MVNYVDTEVFVLEFEVDVYPLFKNISNFFNQRLLSLLLFISQFILLVTLFFNCFELASYFTNFHVHKLFIIVSILNAFFDGLAHVSLVLLIHLAILVKNIHLFHKLFLFYLRFDLFLLYSILAQLFLITEAFFHTFH